MNTPTCRIIVGDALEQLRLLPAESVQCCVTSPPYFNLRDYKIDGQIGLEKTPSEFVARLVAVFREVRRVLKSNGVFWVNLGDSYAGSWGAQSRGDDYPGTLQGSSTLSARQILAHPQDTQTGSLKNTPGLKNKDLIGIPWRVAFALQEDGWYLRSDIIWHKPNCMPESVLDRPTRSHEYIFLLSKSERYYYDADSIKEPASMASNKRWAQNVGGQHGSDIGNGGAKTNGAMKAVGGPKQFSLDGEVDLFEPAPHDYIQSRKARANPAAKSNPDDEVNGIRSDKQRGHGRRHEGFNARWDAMPRPEQCSGLVNKRDVWTVSPACYKDAHFATFPPELILPCILAGSATGDTVIDPFFGSGTTGQVSLELGRNCIGIELNPAYAAMAQRRISNTTPGFIS